MEQIVKNDKIPITGSPRSRHERAKDKLLAVCEMGHDPSMKEVLGCTAAFIKFQRIIRLCMGKNNVDLECIIRQNLGIIYFIYFIF